MTAHAGPDAVDNGLVLALDAADTNSYPGSETTWYDLSGNSNDSTLINSPTFENGAIDFNGTDEYAQVNSVTTDLVSSDFTLSALIKGGTQDHKSILSFNTSGGSNRQLWMVRNAGMGVYDGGN